MRSLILLTIGCLGYLFVNYEYVITRYALVHPLSSWDLILGILLTLLLIEASRRAIGPALPITAGFFLAYAYVGPYLPGLLRHSGFSTEMIVDQLYLTTEGIFGMPLGVSATYVILFIIFGTFLEKTGTGQLFMDFASSITGWTRGGPGKISCISSALFGTISGSAVANVMVDGWLSIPLMKRTGFKPPFACAVEATASTGGQIMPPVMGAAAFVMSEFTGIPYITICLYAMIPALLYYLSLFASIHFEAGRTGIKGIPKEELPRLRVVMARRGHMFIPLGIIVYMMIQGYTPMYACIFSTVAVVVLSFIRPETRMNFKTFLKALEESAKNTLGVAAACACAGIVIGVINLTGVGLKFTSFVLFIAGDSLIPALVLTMMAGIVLGMGMPTTPAYIVQAALLIPALIKLGVMNVAAHMFVFYFSTISAITPPVAMAVYAAAGIGGAKLWPTGLWAMRIAATGFIVPFMFVYGPSLLFIGSSVRHRHLLHQRLFRSHRPRCGDDGLPRERAEHLGADRFGGRRLSADQTGPLYRSPPDTSFCWSFTCGRNISQKDSRCFWNGLSRFPDPLTGARPLPPALPLPGSFNPGLPGRPPQRLYIFNFVVFQ